jgi:hypothetical protein
MQDQQTTPTVRGYASSQPRASLTPVATISVTLRYNVRYSSVTHNRQRLLQPASATTSALLLLQQVCHNERHSSPRQQVRNPLLQHASRLSCLSFATINTARTSAVDQLD